MSKHAAAVIQLSVLAGITALVAVGLWQIHAGDPMLVRIDRTPAGIMDTECRLRAVVPANRQDVASRGLDKAVAELRQTEQVLSAWRSDSNISELNAAEAGINVRLEPETLAILAMSKELTKQTAGAFDVTYKPLFAVWGPKTGKRPSDETLHRTQQACGWTQYRLDPDSAVKFHDDAKIDLGGIAKGYGIDRAVEAMRSAGVAGGLVEVGGDIRCFGTNAGGQQWRIRIQDPFYKQTGKSLGVLLLDEGAVCTSGNYQRFVTIEGQEYSHILDPRSQRPVETVPSVTVVAATAVEADAWATALSVVAGRGKDAPPPAGALAALDMLKGKKIEAMIVVGTGEDHTIHKTPGFAALLETPAAAKPR